MHRGNCSLNEDNERKDLKTIIIVIEATSDTIEVISGARDAELLIARRSDA